MYLPIAFGRSEAEEVLAMQLIGHLRKGRGEVLPEANLRVAAAGVSGNERQAVVVVGDTPADITCGEAFGARTVAVATGVYSRRQLEECRPDFLFDSLENTASVWNALMR